MSDNNNKEETSKSRKTSDRSPSPNPFHISLSSPRSTKSDSSSNKSTPRSPRLEQLPNGGIRIPSANSQFMTAASPPSFCSIDQFMNAANVAQNLSLAHEISVNQNFKLEKLELNPNSLEKQIHDSVHKAFWDTLKDDLNKIPPDYKHTFVLLNEIKEALLALLLPNHGKIKERIVNVMDMELIKQQMNENTFNYEEYSMFVCEIMSRLCAPIRDESIENIKKLKEPIEVFRAIMETLELLKLDMANFTIAQMRPHIQQQVVVYEQKKFKEFLDIQKEAGIDGLEATHNWLLRAYSRIKESKTIGDFKYDSGLTASSITNEAFMEIFVWTSDFVFPETMAMDEMRLNEIYVKCRKYLVVCTIINSIYTLVGEALYGYAELKNKLKQNVIILLDDFMQLTFEDMMKNIAEEAVKLTNEALVVLNKKTLDEDREKCVRDMIIGLSAKNLRDNSVYRLLFGRYIEFIQGILTKRTQGPVKLPQGMSLMEKELIEMTGQFIRLVSFNKNVFGIYYGEIIENIKTSESKN